MSTDKVIYKGNSRIMMYLHMLPYLLKDLFAKRKIKFHRTVKVKKFKGGGYVKEEEVEPGITFGKGMFK
jgi:hypothetical protein